MKRSLGTRLTGFTLSFTVFLSNVALVHATESNFWRERQNQATQSSKSFQVASLPTSSLLPNVSSALSSSSLHRNHLAPVADSALEKPLSLLSAQAGTIRGISKAKNADRYVIHVQDVHLNEEAQRNIAAAVRSLGRSVDLVALEGAFQPIIVEPLRTFPSKKGRDMTAEYLLRNGRISGPVYAEMTADQAGPAIVGIDDQAAYNENVNAYKTAQPVEAKEKKVLEARHQELLAHIYKELDQNESQLVRLVEDYRADRVGLSDYVSALSAVPGSRLTPELKKFLDARAMEKSLDFKAVERERTLLLEKLISKLTQADQKDLLNHTVAYRTGQLTHGEYYDYLKSLCSARGVQLKDHPAMSKYIKYVVLAESLDGERVLSDVQSLEDAAIERAARTPMQKSLLTQLTINYLEGKLVDFSMTRGEWEQYKAVRGATSSTLSLKPFLSFYEAAERRDDLMAQNLDRVMKEHHAKVAVVVTGGFHSNGMTSKLNARHITTAQFVPALSKADGSAGTTYLSAFAREKTPLDRMFQGEKLFLATPPAQTGGGTGIMAAAAVHEKDLTPNKAQESAGSNVSNVVEKSNERVLVNGPISLEVDFTPAEISEVKILKAQGESSITILSALWKRTRKIFVRATALITVIGAAINGHSDTITTSPNSISNKPFPTNAPLISKPILLNPRLEETPFSERVYYQGTTLTNGMSGFIVSNTRNETTLKLAHYDQQAAAAGTLTWYNDQGLHAGPMGNQPSSFITGSAANFSLNASYTPSVGEGSAPEGKTVIRAEQKGFGFGFFGIANVRAAGSVTPEVPRDYSQYAGGELRFQLRSTQPLEIRIGYVTATGVEKKAAVRIPSTDDKWQSIVLPFDLFNAGGDFNLAAITEPFLMVTSVPTVWYVDQIEYVKPVAGWIVDKTYVWNRGNNTVVLPDGRVVTSQSNNDEWGGALWQMLFKLPDADFLEPDPTLSKIFEALGNEVGKAMQKGIPYFAAERPNPFNPNQSINVNFNSAYWGTTILTEHQGSQPFGLSWDRYAGTFYEFNSVTAGNYLQGTGLLLWAERADQAVAAFRNAPTTQLNAVRALRNAIYAEVDKALAIPGETLEQISPDGKFAVFLHKNISGPTPTTAADQLVLRSTQNWGELNRINIAWNGAPIEFAHVSITPNGQHIVVESDKPSEISPMDSVVSVYDNVGNLQGEVVIPGSGQVYDIADEYIGVYSRRQLPDFFYIADGVFGKIVGYPSTGAYVIASKDVVNNEVEQSISIGQPGFPGRTYVVSHYPMTASYMQYDDDVVHVDSDKSHVAVLTSVPYELDSRGVQVSAVNEGVVFDANGRPVFSSVLQLGTDALIRGFLVRSNGVEITYSPVTKVNGATHVGNEVVHLFPFDVLPPAFSAQVDNIKVTLDNAQLSVHLGGREKNIRFDRGSKNIFVTDQGKTTELSVGSAFWNVEFNNLLLSVREAADRSIYATDAVPFMQTYNWFSAHVEHVTISNSPISTGNWSKAPSQAATPIVLNLYGEAFEVLHWSVANPWQATNLVTGVLIENLTLYRDVTYIADVNFTGSMEKSWEITTKWAWDRGSDAIVTPDGLFVFTRDYANWLPASNEMLNRVSRAYAAGEQPQLGLHQLILDIQAAQQKYAPKPIPAGDVQKSTPRPSALKSPSTLRKILPGFLVLFGASSYFQSFAAAARDEVTIVDCGSVVFGLVGLIAILLPSFLRALKNKGVPSRHETGFQFSDEELKQFSRMPKERVAEIQNVALQEALALQSIVYGRLHGEDIAGLLQNARIDLSSLKGGRSNDLQVMLPLELRYLQYSLGEYVKAHGLNIAPEISSAHFTEQFMHDKNGEPISTFLGDGEHYATTISVEQIGLIAKLNKQLKPGQRAHLFADEADKAVIDGQIGILKMVNKDRDVDVDVTYRPGGFRQNNVIDIRAMAQDLAAKKVLAQTQFAVERNMLYDFVGLPADIAANLRIIFLTDFLNGLAISPGKLEDIIGLARAASINA